MANNLAEIENRLLTSADELRAIFRLKSFEYSVPVLRLIFRWYADRRFTQSEKELSGNGDWTAGHRQGSLSGQFPRPTAPVSPIC
jgi:hypothetical protein